jgi:adenylate cyclase
MLRVQLNNKWEHQQFEHPGGPLELGRGPKRGNVARCVIQDPYVSRDHVTLVERGKGMLHVENLSERNPIWLGDSTSLAPREGRDCSLPLRLSLGETVIDLEAADDGGVPESLETIAQPARSRSPFDGGRSLLQLGGSPSPETLIEWFDTVIAVQRAAAGSPEFYEQTAEAMVNLVGLDRGMVLLRRGETWEVVASAGRDDGDPRGFSHTILRHVVADAMTYYQPVATTSPTESLQGIKAVVASPIFDARDNIVGVLYGTRTRGVEVRGGAGIGKIQAYVVQLLASAVGAGLARLEKEAEVSRQRVQFEQFFSADLARELARNPRLLEGQEREVTVMFSDIRGFSRLAEKLGPTDICRLVSDVMDRITARVKEFEGVVVDYFGDGMLAMWNAPAEQPDHAALACRAGLAILGDLPALSAEWREKVGTPLGVGIGLNTGRALVGNTGSRYKFKYGPFGHVVNLASRVEGATKHMQIPLLVTGFTQAQLGDPFATRRLCKVRVVGIQDAVDLYELRPETAVPEWLSRRDAYEKALALFEAGQWHQAYQAVSPLLAGQTGSLDVPSLELAAWALECLKTPPANFDPILELKSK